MNVRGRGLIVATMLVLGASAGPASSQDVIRDEVEGIRNLARIEATVACAGAITPESVTEIRRLGFASVINLRLASEPGANVDQEAAAAEAAGIRYFHVPYDGSADPAAAEQFLDAITAEGAEPAFVHCAGGNRAATMWLIKRIAIDGWDVARATEEAVALGQRSEDLRQFAVDFAQAYRE